MPHEHHEDHKHIVKITIPEHHKAEYHSGHYDVGAFIATHTGYTDAHAHWDEEHHKPHEEAPDGYHWAFNPGHWDEWHGEHGHNFHKAEWVFHHSH